MGVPAVFLDKDGTLIRDVPYNVDPALVQLTTGAAEALARLHEAGYVFVVVSNQPGVALGRFPVDALAGVEKRLRELLRSAGVPLLGFYFCPHAPTAGPGPGCGCRKPSPGLLLEAARDHHLDLSASWMIGDILDDVEAGRTAGCRTILIDPGGETEWRRSPSREPHAVARHLPEAASIILQPGQPGRRCHPVARLSLNGGAETRNG